MEELEQSQILDISKIKIIPSDTEIPVHNNSILTKRALCSNFPENSVILDLTEAITKIITDISDDLENNKQLCIVNIPEYLEELQAVFNPLNVEECTPDIFKEGIYTTIDSLEELKKFLSELLIRFDTSPKNYTKEDYGYLLGILYKSLIHLYEYNPNNVIVTTWSNPLSDKYVPSEKLTKETIDAESERIEGLISDETSARQSADSDLQDNIDSEAGIRASEITRIERLISDEAVTRQQADTNLQNTKLDNLTAGDNISIINNTISAVDTIYDDTEVKSDISNLLLNKLDKLIAGSNIQITGTIISATDTIYDDTTISNRVTDIENKIPLEASSNNLLADKDYVDLNIATSSATFKGTYNSILELNQVTADNNDYAFVISADVSGNTIYNRYKYDGSLWLFEYALNNSSFTTSLWNAINSGITSLKVATYDGYLSLILAAL